MLFTKRQIKREFRLRRRRLLGRVERAWCRATGRSYDPQAWLFRKLPDEPVPPLPEAENPHRDGMEEQGRLSALAEEVQRETPYLDSRMVAPAAFDATVILGELETLRQYLFELRSNAISSGRLGEYRTADKWARALFVLFGSRLLDILCDLARNDPLVIQKPPIALVVPLFMLTVGASALAYRNSRRAAREKDRMFPKTIPCISPDRKVTASNPTEADGTYHLPGAQAHMAEMHAAGEQSPAIPS